MNTPTPTQHNPTPNQQPTMNEETKTPEPLADIIAEMRRYGANSPRVLALADRIEAAANLEYQEAKDYFAMLHDGPSMICTAKNCAVRNIGLSLAAAPRKFDEAAPGNAAAMREALEWVAQLAELGVDDELGADGQNILTAAEMARAALAAPDRNCDRTKDEAEELFKARFGRPWTQTEDELAAFLFAPAEGGGHA